MATAARVKTFFAVVGPLAAGTAYANSRSWKGVAQARHQELLAEKGKVTELELELKKTKEQLRITVELSDRQDRLAAIERKLEEGAQKGWEEGLLTTFLTSLVGIGAVALRSAF